MIRRLALVGWVVGMGVAAPPCAAARQLSPLDEGCVTCHRDLDDARLAEPAIDFGAADIHAERGFGCLDCHGPDPTGASSALDPATGFLAKPTRQGVIALCGRCHSNGAFMRGYNPALRVDQVAEYATSVHGRRLAEENDPNVAVCTSCHPAHQIRPPSDNESSVHPLNVAATCGACHADTVRMVAYDIPTDQRRLYEQSVHWQWMTEQEDLAAPTCNDCHGNHGAAPPGLASVHNVCGQCHSVMATYFSNGPHDAYFSEAGLPECATCHGNHGILPARDDLLAGLNESVCALCHEPGEVGAETFPRMWTLIDSLQAAAETAEATLREAENLGMEVSQAQFALEDVNTALVRARTAVHAFDADSVRAQVDVGLAVTGQARERGTEALDEHLFRRQGLAVSVVLILLLIGSIALTIRRLEHASPEG